MTKHFRINKTHKVKECTDAGQCVYWVLITVIGTHSLQFLTWARGIYWRSNINLTHNEVNVMFLYLIHREITFSYTIIIIINPPPRQPRHIKKKRDMYIHMVTIVYGSNVNWQIERQQLMNMIRLQYLFVKQLFHV